MGASGFIGSHVLAAGQAAGLDIRPLDAARHVWPSGSLPHPCGSAWETSYGVQLSQLTAAVAGLDVVVNAAGYAGPASTDHQRLMAANVVLPVILAVACRRADVRRLVHVSTAAVQGRLDPLDESDRCQPFSPYSRSKAEAEQRLQQLPEADRPAEVVLYRPTSVHGPDRGITRILCRIARGPLVIVGGDGDQPLPVSLIQNVAAGILYSATSRAPMSIVVQPSEGVTTRRLLELLGANRVLSLPQPPVRMALRTARPVFAAVPPLTSALRSLELLYLGQGVAESTLTGRGFIPPVGLAGWSTLADGTAGDSVRRSAVTR